MPDNEWQPVRLCFATEHDNQSKAKSRAKCRIVGQIVKVRPTANRGKCRCDGEMYVVHPDDVARLIDLTADEEFQSFLVCEHQILAD